MPISIASASPSPSGNRVINSGNRHSRIRILDRKSQAIAEVRALSKKIKTDKPGFDLLHATGLRKRVFIQVKNEKGKMGYQSLSAESVRKRFGLKKDEFYAEMKNGKGDITTYLEEKIAEKTKTYANLGCDYLYGRNGKPIDEKKAFQFFQKAAQANEPEGYGNIAYCYSHGRGIQQDSKQAKEFLKKMLLAHKKESRQVRALESYAALGVKEVTSLKQSKPTVLNNLGQFYLEGKNTKKAIDLFQRANRLGHPDAKWNLAHCLLYSKDQKANESGRAVLKELVNEARKSPNETGSLERLERLLGEGGADRLYKEEPFLYVIRGKYLFSGNGIMSKFVGFSMIQKVAASHVPEGAALLVYCYKNGIGIEKNEKKAAELLNKMHKTIKDDLDRYLKIAETGNL